MTKEVLSLSLFLFLSSSPSPSPSPSRSPSSSPTPSLSPSPSLPIPLSRFMYCADTREHQTFLPPYISVSPLPDFEMMESCKSCRQNAAILLLAACKASVCLTLGACVPLPSTWAYGNWEGVAMDSLRFYLGPPSSTLLRPAAEPPLKLRYGRIRGGPPAERMACGRLLPLEHPTPYAYAGPR
jgi:hypothetical protein